MDKWNEQNGFGQDGSRANMNSPFSDDQMYSYDNDNLSPAYAMPTQMTTQLDSVKAEPTVSF